RPRKLGECHRYRRDRRGLDDRKETPPVQETGQRIIRLFKIDVLASGLGEHPAQLPIADSRYDGHEPGDQPYEDQPAGATGPCYDILADNKNAGSDHRPGNDHGAIQQAERGFEMGRSLSGPGYLRLGCFCHNAKNSAKTPKPLIPGRLNHFDLLYWALSPSNRSLVILKRVSLL